MLDALFRPKSVAVIGASNRELTIGYRIVQNLVDSGYQGPIFTVNPKAPFIKNFVAYKDITDVPMDVDLAHIIVKNTRVPEEIEKCGKKGVKVVIVNTAGFREIGPEGIKLEEEMLAVAKKYGVRVFGPNCQGVMNSDPEVRAYCNFTFTRMVPGSISVMAQSGGVGEVINNRLFEMGLGFRMYASYGNQSDINATEILAYWGDDPGTKVILLHIETLSDAAGFAKVAAEITKKKPILAMKTGRTKLGAKAVSSHTGGMMAVDTSTNLLLEKCGILTFNDEEELCQAARALSALPAAAGNRVGIITNTGGPGIIVTDEIIEHGCEMAELTTASQQVLRENLYPEASIANPVDVLATATPEHYQLAAETLMNDPQVDIVFVNFITPFFVDTEGVARGLVSVAKTADKPMIVVMMTEKEGWASTLKIFAEAGIPTFDMPEIGGRVAASMARYAQLKKRQEATDVSFTDIDRAAADRLLEKTRENGRQFMSQSDAFSLLAAYGLPVIANSEVADGAGAVAAATVIGYPVTLKVESEDVVHKSDAGGVVLNLKNDAELEDAFVRLGDSFPGSRVFVQQYITPGVEIMVGAHRENAELGHVIAFGLGGIFVEVLKDVMFRLNPLTKEDIDAMVRGIKGYPILAGIRGQKGVDLAKIEEVIGRLSVLLANHPNIEEMDLNPIFAYPHGQEPGLVDVRIKLS
ncbi:MAG: acetate--CoA ligase family protein [Deltaproteobacteria bacterium]|nr:acetate--CoA ligase family protein [Candidatus Anaeroferrophillus wilburensis]MBN2889128.1 acetate--CoA ligase family protein [Deltaproteobacteria bacterium]